MHPASDESLVDFLLEETGDRLHLVMRYEGADWEMLYQSEVAERALDSTIRDGRDLLGAFRDEGRRNTDLDGLFSLGSYYCSLHLFGDLVLLHFGQERDRGIILGFHPRTAPHLTDFVSTILPYLHEAGLGAYAGEPPWSDRPPVSGIGRR